MQVTTRCSHPIKLFRRHQAQFGRHYALESTQFVIHTAMYCAPILWLLQYEVHSLEWAVEERLRLCSDVWYCRLPSFLKRNKLAGMFALQPLSGDKSWYLGGMHYAIRRPFRLFPLSIGSFSEELTEIPGSQRPLGFYQNQIIVAGFLWLKIFVSWTMDMHWYHLNIRRYGEKWQVALVKLDPWCELICRQVEKRSASWYSFKYRLVFGGTGSVEGTTCWYLGEMGQY